MKGLQSYVDSESEPLDLLNKEFSALYDFKPNQLAGIKYILIQACVLRGYFHFIFFSFELPNILLLKC